MMTPSFSPTLFPSPYHLSFLFKELPHPSQPGTPGVFSVLGPVLLDEAETISSGQEKGL